MVRRSPSTTRRAGRSTQAVGHPDRRRGRRHSPRLSSAPVADFKKHWRQLTVSTDAGELEYTVFPGPQPFIGATRLAGTPISPADAHVRLVALGHEHALLDFIGNLASITVEPRRSI